MNVGKVIMGMGVAVGMLSSTVAMAATPAASAPVQGIRTAAPLKHKSHQSDDSSSQTGTYVVGGLAAAAVIAGVVVVATDKKNHNNSASPG